MDSAENTEPSAAANVSLHCKEIALAAGVPAELRAMLSAACLVHHHPPTDVKGPFVPILDTIHHGAKERGSWPAKLAEILEIANSLDEQLSLAEGDEHPIERAFEEMSYMDYDPALTALLPIMRRANRRDVLATIPLLPVFPALATRAIALLGSADSDFREVQRVAGHEQVLSGELLRTANSAVYGSRRPATSIEEALTRLGTEPASRIITAAALRPVLGGKGLTGLWEHALAAAETAEKLARLSGKVRPHEAFLAGLVHDVGRLAIALLPDSAQAARRRLAASGCDPIVLEQVLIGMDHAEAGAEILDFWKFPEPVITGVWHHHRIERHSSCLAAVLYLTEYLTQSSEDLPDQSRLDLARATLGVSAGVPGLVYE